MDLFRLCPQVSERTLFAPPDARAMFLHDDLHLPCNGTCSVTGGGALRTGSTNGKDP